MAGDCHFYCCLYILDSVSSCIEREREFLSDLSHFWVQFDFDFQIKEPKVYHDTVDGRHPKQPTGMYKNLVNDYIMEKNLPTSTGEFTGFPPSITSTSTCLYTQCLGPRLGKHLRNLPKLWWLEGGGWLFGWPGDQVVGKRPVAFLGGWHGGSVLVFSSSQGFSAFKIYEETSASMRWARPSLDGFFGGFFCC